MEIGLIKLNLLFYINVNAGIGNTKGANTFFIKNTRNKMIRKIKDLIRIMLEILILPVVLPLFAVMLVKKAYEDNKPLKLKNK